MFLTPIILVGLVGSRQIALWAYLVSFTSALLGAMAYFLRDNEIIAQMLYDGHKYEQLLQICVLVLSIGFGAVLLGSTSRTNLVKA